MKCLACFLAGWMWSAISATAADGPHLALWVTDSIRARSAIACAPIDNGAAVPRPTTRPTLTEHDVSAWNRNSARWLLKPERFTGKDAPVLQDRCFILAVDGVVISTGVVLSSHSSRLTDFPTMRMTKSRNAVELQLTASNRGRNMRLIHVDALDRVLGTQGFPN